MAQFDLNAVQQLVFQAQAMRLGLKPLFLPILPKQQEEIAFVDAIPRAGERIAPADGTRCEVTEVWHQLLVYPQQDFQSTVTLALVKRLAGRAGQ